MTIRYLEKDRTLTNEANKILGVDSAGKLPAVDGSQLTNLTFSGASNTRQLSYIGAYGSSTTINMVTNGIYAVTSSGPQFTIDSNLKNNYQNGDMIYIKNYTASWFNLINADSANVKLFVKGNEVTSWRSNTIRGIWKLRLTLDPTTSGLIVHLVEDVSILNDFIDVIDDGTAYPGSILKYNPSTSCWQPALNWQPKIITIDNSNVGQWITSFDVGGSTPSPGSWNISIDLSKTLNYNNVAIPSFVEFPFSTYIFIFTANQWTNDKVGSATYGETRGFNTMSRDGVVFRLPTIDNTTAGKTFTFIDDSVPYTGWDWPNNSLWTPIVSKGISIRISTAAQAANHQIEGFSPAVSYSDGYFISNGKTSSSIAWPTVSLTAVTTDMIPNVFYPGTLQGTITSTWQRLTFVN
jgi:hypothetical protein